MLHLVLWKIMIFKCNQDSKPFSKEKNYVNTFVKKINQEGKQNIKVKKHVYICRIKYLMRVQSVSKFTLI